MTEVDVDAATAAADVTAVAIMAGGFPAVIIPAVISCGSSSYCACAEITAADVTMAAIPYLPPKGRQIFSVYQKAAEFLNTVSILGITDSGGGLSAMSTPAQEPMNIINDIRGFCYGPSRDKLTQIVNMMAIAQMLQLMKMMR